MIFMAMPFYVKFQPLLIDVNHTFKISGLSIYIICFRFGGLYHSEELLSLIHWLNLYAWMCKNVMFLCHNFLQIYNLCIEERYDPSHFHGRVEAYPFDDNHVPPLQMIKIFCESVYSWLSCDPKNIAVIHCMVCLRKPSMWFFDFIILLYHLLISFIIFIF